MTPLALMIQLILKPLVIIGLGALQYLASKSFSAASRYMNLLVVLLLLPVAVLLGVAVEAPITIQLPDWGETQRWLMTAWGRTLVAIYLFGVMWGVFYLLLGVWALRGKTVDSMLPDYQNLQTEIDRLCDLTGITKPVTLVLSEVDDSIASWGWLKPHIQLPAEAGDWHSAERQLILLHELGHIARQDWMLLIVSKLIGCLFWFLPPVWWLQTVLTDLSERACDDWVVEISGRNQEYAQLLVSLEKQVSDLPVSHLWAQSNFERIKALLERYADHDIRLGKKQWGLSVLLGMLLLVPMTVVGFRTPLDQSPNLYRHQLLSEFLSGMTPAAPNANALPAAPEYLALARAEQSRIKPVYIDAPVILSRPKMELIDVIAKPQSTLDTHFDWSQEKQVLSSKERSSSAGLMASPSVRVKGFLPVRMVTPIYPSRAINRGIEGRVKVQFTVTAEGLPIESRVVYAQPKGVFEKSVFQALKQSRFQPMTINGTAVDVKGVSEEFIFQLSDDEGASPARTRSPPAMTAIAFSH